MRKYKKCVKHAQTSGCNENNLPPADMFFPKVAPLCFLKREYYGKQQLSSLKVGFEVSDVF